MAQNLTNGDDIWTGGAGAETIFGLAGNDRLFGMGGADLLYGGEGDDRLFATEARGDGPPDLVPDSLFGRTGNDLLWADFGDLVDGGTGNDLFTSHFSGGPLGALRLNLTQDCWVAMDGVNKTHLMGIEHVVIQCGGGSDTITSGAVNDTVYGGSGADVVHLGGGDDLVVLDARDAFIADGGAGVDRLALDQIGANAVISVVGTNSVVIDGVARQVTGFETLTLFLNGSATVTGGAYGDSLTGNDRLWAKTGDGADRILFDGGKFTLDAGGGNDDLAVFDGFGTAHGGSGDDRISGFSAVESETLWGDAGNDRIVVVNGLADQVYGGKGNDQVLVTGISGVAVLDGGSGTDGLHLVSVTSSSETVDTGIRTAYGTAGYEIRAMSGALVLAATGFETFDITGTGFGDVLSGGARADILHGDPAFTTGSDTLKGKGGNDMLIGGWGQDVLAGGLGHDVFAFVAPRDSALGEADVITDFDRGADRIDLSAIDANTAAPENEAFNLLANGGLFTGVAGQLRSFIVDGVTYVRGDLDGDGTPDISIQITGAFHLTPGDFVL